jgi:peptide/nickel transport system permease protein
MQNIFIKYLNYKNMQLTEKIGFLVLFIFLLMTLFPNFVATHDPLEQDIISRLQNPSLNNIFGTDELGRDIYSRCVYGANTSVSTAFIAVLFALIVGVSTGLFSGYSGGIIDEFLSRFNDILFSFPGIIIAMALIAVTGQNAISVALVIGLVDTPIIFRVTRAVSLQIKVLPYVDAVKSAGASKYYIMLKTVLPNCSNEIFVQALLIATRAIIIESSLSFLGLGIPPPSPSWGSMLSIGRSYLYRMVWYGIIPGIFIMMLVISLQFVSRYIQRISKYSNS